MKPTALRRRTSSSPKRRSWASSATTRAKPACGTWSASWRRCAAKSPSNWSRTTASARVKITSSSLSKYLGPPRFRYGLAETKPHVGVATGLAWTELGGELLSVEVTIVPGRGKLTVTGQLGDVMRESAHAALSYVRSRATALGLDPNFYQKIEIHIHLPEGAVPKDGPSAGITLATALVSALCKVPVRNDLAMTGEITLRGRVLPISGLKEKALAAHRGGIKIILMPKENEKDIQDIPPEVLKNISLVQVEHMDDVLKRALVLDDPETTHIRGISAMQAPSMAC